VGKKVANQIDQLLSEIRGGEWAPRGLIPPRILDELMRFMRVLRTRIESDEEYPQQMKRYIALLDLHISRANVARRKDNVAFLQHLTNALIDVQDIVEWYYRNKNSLKEEQKNG
jgi:hypothetical protein